MVFTFDPPESEPPAHNPLVLDDNEDVTTRITDKSPKSIAFPVDAIVI